MSFFRNWEIRAPKISHKSQSSQAISCVYVRGKTKGVIGNICYNSFCDLLDANLKNTRLHFKGQLHSHETQRLCVFDTNEPCLYSGWWQTNIRLNLDHKMFLLGIEASLGTIVLILKRMLLEISSLNYWHK